MAKIVILMGRGSSGKTRTINCLAGKLGLHRDKRNYPRFVTWVGQAEEIFVKTGSLQEEAFSELREVLAQTSSTQERNKAVLDKVLAETQDWIDLLKDKLNTVAIIPFTLRGLKGNTNAMRDLILQPLALFRESGNEVKLVYLKKEKIRQRSFVESVVTEAKPDHEILSKKNKEERQADELLAYLSLKPIIPLVTHSLLEF